MGTTCELGLMADPIMNWPRSTFLPGSFMWPSAGGVLVPATSQDPNFWNNAARKPHMKALLQTDDHWKLLGGNRGMNMGHGKFQEFIMVNHA